MAGAGDLADYQVGRRFVCEGFTGTILYVGKVPPTDGMLRLNREKSQKNFCWTVFNSVVHCIAH